MYVCMYSTTLHSVHTYTHTYTTHNHRRGLGNAHIYKMKCTPVAPARYVATAGYIAPIVICTAAK